MLVRMKDTCPENTIVNDKFRIEKGEVKRFPEDMSFDDSIFWKVSIDGEIPMSPKSAEDLQKLLVDHHKINDFREEVLYSDLILEDLSKLIELEKKSSNRSNEIISFLKTLLPNPDILAKELEKREAERKKAARVVLEQVKQTLDNKDADNFLDQNTRTILKNLKEQDLTKSDLALVLKKEKVGKKRKNLIEKIKGMI